MEAQGKHFKLNEPGVGCMYQLRKIGAVKTFRNKNGEKIAVVADIHLHAPTKKGDDWSYYIGELRLNSDGKIIFDITHISSSAWGSSAMKTAPFGYEREDIKKFVLRECAAVISDWRQQLAT
jgi:hypothetical protein